MVGKGLKKAVLALGILAGGLFSSEVYADRLRLANSGDEATVGGDLSYCKHLSGATDNFDIGYDSEWSNPGISPYFKITSINSSKELSTDCRSTNSETLFNYNLSLVALGNLTCTNRIKFSFPLSSDQDTNRIYLAKIHCNTNWTPGKKSFDKVVNIRDVIRDNSGYVDLPGIVNCPNGTIYGAVDVSCRFLRDPNITDMTFSSAKGTNTTILKTQIQPGSYVADTVQRSTNLGTTVWNNFSTGSYGYSNGYVTPTLDNFDQTIPATNTIQDTNNAAFYRISRYESTTNSPVQGLEKALSNPVSTSSSNLRSQHRVFLKK